MRCSECRKDVPTGSGYCPYCGTPLVPQVSSHRTQPVKSRNQQGIPILTFNVNGILFNMIKVEGGAFYKGINLQDVQRLTQQRVGGHGFPLVSVDTFYMAETTVTQGLWETVIHEEDNLIDYWDAQKGTNNPSYIKGRDLPVYVIRFTELDAFFFINKLNMLTGWTFSLPTGEQWEFAARGGNLTKGYLYAGSNNINDVAWYRDNSWQYTLDKTNPLNIFHKERVPHPVKMKRPNELGLYDMSGNVGEVCLGGGGIRGGSYYDGDYRCQIHDGGGEYKGFRLVLNKKDNMR